MKKKFSRRDSVRFSKLGKNRKNLQKWIKPKGRDNKMRLKMKGYPLHPTVGDKSKKSDYGKIDGLTPVLVHNISELENLDKNSIVIIARVGKKKKMDIIKKADEMKLKIKNIRKEKIKWIY